MNTLSRFAAAALTAALLFTADAAALPGTEGTSAPEAAKVAPEAAPITAPPAPDGSKSPENAATNDQLQAEVCALREDMRMLQSTLDLMVNKIMADLREENEQLRLEIRRLNTLRGVSGMADINSVPRPAGSAVDQALAGPEPVPELPPPPPFKFTVIREWGRTAEDAQKLGSEAQSLKGVIGVVPAGSLREDVEKLARDLRSRYDEYDNINIEVFNDPVVAREFAANKAADPERRVLSVSRHKASNRDAIVLLTNGKGEMISLDPSEPPPPQQRDDLPTLSVTNPVAPGQSIRPKAADAELPVEETAAVPQTQDAAPAPEAQAEPGQWQKTGKTKGSAKGSSSKNKGEAEEEPVLPQRQRPIPEGPLLLVPHIPAQPETTVLVAPPGEPMAPEPAESETVAPAKDDEAGKADEPESSEEPAANPKSNFGPKSKKKGR